MIKQLSIQITICSVSGVVHMRRFMGDEKKQLRVFLRACKIKGIYVESF